MPTGDVTWKAGVLTVPSSAGSVSISGLGGTPDAVFFYGTNWLTEDAVVTTPSCGLFRGLSARQYDSPGTLMQSVGYAAPAGDCHQTDGSSCILALDSAGGTTVLFQAALTSLDADGFTVSFSTGASGGYKVVYIALMGNGANVAAARTSSGSIVAALGWKAGAMLFNSVWGGPDVAGGNRTQETYGGAAFPGSSPGAWQSAALTANTFPTSASGQYDIGIDNFPPGTMAGRSVTFVGPFLTAANITTGPQGTGQNDLRLALGHSDNTATLVAWDDEDSLTGRTTPPVSAGDQSTVTLPFNPGLVLGYTVSNEPNGQGTGSRGAIGFSVATRDFQWTAIADGQPSLNAFQSFQRGFADGVNGGNAHAGTMELLFNAFRLTTVEDDTTRQNMVWHAFGHPPRKILWIPQSYRFLQDSDRPGPKS